jgi:hypothetical protein
VDLGPSLGVSVGAYASPTLRVGLEGSGWTHDDVGAREFVYRAGVIALLTPERARGANLIAGFGWSGYRAEEFRYDAPRLTLGVGWEQRLADDWRVGNQLTFDGAAFGSLKNRDTRVAQGVGLSVMRFSVHVRHK